MDPTEFIVLLSRLATGAIATFFAILLWSQTRDASWVLVIIATLVSYAEIVISTLETFGVLTVDFLDVSGFPVFRMVLVNLPLVFLTLAFISMIARRRFP